MQAPTKATEIGLVLQGGGALGAYEYGAITALLELIDEAAGKGRAVSLKAVTGVSIGAINAACVVGAATRTDARRRLASLWNDLVLETPVFWPRAARRDLALRLAQLLFAACRRVVVLNMDACLRYAPLAADPYASRRFCRA